MLEYGQHNPRRGGKPVVITGVGLCTSLGTDAGATWRSILAGSIGIVPLTEVESALPDNSLGGQCLELPADYRPDLSRESRFLRWTIEHAMQDAGMVTLSQSRCRPDRCFAMLGTTLHGMRAGGRFLRSGNVHYLNALLAGATAARSLDGLGIEGGTATTCSACSSSLGAIALGVTMLECGRADVVIAGGYDAISEYAWGGFNALRLIAPSPLRPFCSGRQGMKVGEGYGIVVLERAADAAARGARPLARLSGWGESADAHHLTKPHPAGEGALAAMRTALGRAGLAPNSIDLITAHATGTPDNDASEFAALAGLLGIDLPNVPVVAHKSRLGHTLGGAGAVELVLTVLALADQLIPTTANVAPADVEFGGLNVSTGAPVKAPIRHTLNTSLGFGGANTCVVLSHPTAVIDNRQAGTTNRVNACISGIGVILPGAVGVHQFASRLRDQPGINLPEAITDATLAGFSTARRARRMSQSVRLALAAAELALGDALLLSDAQRLSTSSCLMGSMHGSVGFCAEYYTQIVRDGALAANPVLFAEGVPNAAAAHISTAFNIRGSCQIIIGSRTAGLDALSLAASRVESGAAEMVTVVAMEEQSPAVDAAYAALGLGAKREASARSFRTSHGAVAFVVESAAASAARGVPGWAHIGPSASACLGSAGVPRAVARVLKRLGQCDGVIASSNGTWLDQAEAFGIRHAHQTPVPGVPATSIFGELFAVTPFLGVVTALVTGDTPLSLISLCSDWEGSVSALRIETLAGRAAR